MAYTAGNTILDDEYNNFAASVNSILSTGSGDSGYGQGAVSTVAAGTVISATQWASLLNKITTAANHQGTSITAITNPVSTDTITAEAALAGNITAIDNARFNAAASGTPITAGGVSSRTATWNNTIDSVQRVTFASLEAMRFFFNAGGRITVTYSRTGGTASNKNTGWSNLCTACGTLNMTGAAAAKTIAAVSYTGFSKKGGSGTPQTLATTIGENALTTSNQTVFRQYDATAQYTANYIQFGARVGSGTPELILTSTAVDDANANTDENIDGTFSSTVTIIPPSTTQLTSTWGTPTLSTTNAY